MRSQNIDKEQMFITASKILKAKRAHQLVGIFSILLSDFLVAFSSRI